MDEYAGRAVLSRHTTHTHTHTHTGTHIHTYTQSRAHTHSTYQTHTTHNRPLTTPAGLGSFDASATHDVKIFSLAILLSSYFIYNSMGTIDENALDKLSCVHTITHITH